MCPAANDNVPPGGYRAIPSGHRMKAGERRREAMSGVLFMLGTIVIEGGLVLLLMSLFTASEREERREDEKRRLAVVGGRGLRRAA